MTKKYMLIELLHKELMDYPTIININDEIYFINELRKADIDDIRSNTDKFISILEQLQISHQDNGIFVSLDKYTDGFDTNFDGSIKI